jgi:transposase InsO family protein
MLTVMDDYTRQALAVHVGTKLGSAEALEALYPLIIQHGKPEHIRSDNGPEFVSDVFQTWLKRVGIEPIHISPGSLWENGYNESFNGTLRNEILNVNWFQTTRQAQATLNCWVKEYNQIRPHQAPDMRPPIPETKTLKLEQT